MTDDQIIKIIETEIENKTLGVTEQYLEIHHFIYKDNKLVFDRIDRSSQADCYIVYFPVVDEKFYFKAFINKETQEMYPLTTEPWHRVYFRATSEIMLLKELTSLTKLTPTESWSKGDLRKNGKSNHTFSSILFLPNPESDTFQNKLKNLLSYLEEDKNGVKQLVDNAFGYIQVAMNIHNGNSMIGGPSIDKEIINRMSELNLGIDFDLYCDGNLFKDHF